MVLSGCQGGPQGSPDQPDRAADALRWAAFEKARDQCMGDNGFPVTVHPDGGRNFSGTGVLGQEELLALLDECAAQAGGEPALLPVTELEKGAMYDLEVEAYECLVEHGYVPDPPPTRERYVETFDTGPWAGHLRVEGGWLPDDECPKPTLEDITW